MQDESCLNDAESVAVRPVAYSDYVLALREGIPLKIELPGLTVTVDCRFCMADAYRTLQGVFCDLISHAYRHFLEN